jgi:hypothetical protein
MRQLTIRERAEDTRAKTIRVLGATIVISWSLFFARFASAIDFPVPTTAQAVQQAPSTESMPAE